MHRYAYPQYGKNAFTCPQCGVFSRQAWSQAHTEREPLNDLHVAYCEKCDGFSLWRNAQMIFPNEIYATDPHPDIPEELICVYEEIRNVGLSSPRAAALLKIAIQKWATFLGQSPSDIDVNHEVSIDMNDDWETVNKLRQILNFHHAKYTEKNHQKPPKKQVQKV